MDGHQIQPADQNDRGVHQAEPRRQQRKRSVDRGKEDMSVKRPWLIAIPAIYMTAAPAHVVHQQSEHAAGGLQVQVSPPSGGAPV